MSVKLKRDSVDTVIQKKIQYLYALTYILQNYKSDKELN